MESPVLELTATAAPDEDPLLQALEEAMRDDDSDRNSIISRLFTDPSSVPRFVADPIYLRREADRLQARRDARRTKYIDVHRPHLCWRCGNTGHTRRECRSPGRLFCSRCGRCEILSRDCPCPRPAAASGPPQIRPARGRKVTKATQCCLLEATTPPKPQYRSSRPASC